MAQWEQGSPARCQSLGMASKTNARALAPVTLIILAGLVILQPQAQMAQDRSQQEAIQLFAGTWKAVCADGKPFVLLTLRVTGSDVTGTISIANIKGDEGQCAIVVDPPSPNHAMKVTDAQMKAKVLAFSGSQRAQF